MTTFEIRKQLTLVRKEKPNPDSLEFGRVFTDHMFVLDYTEGQGWHDPRIIPYQPITLEPSSMVFHYGQTVFEGLKAYKTPAKDVLLFRPEKNISRLNKSSARMSIPPIDEELALEGLKQLVALDRDWVPDAPGTSLYIRPFIIATEQYLGVAPSKNYQFIIIMSPVGSYYKEGMNPVKILVEQEYVRAVKGGTGEAKTGGNYASSLKGQQEATALGYSQTLWLDGKEHKYIEEVGSMNVFFVIDGVAVTPELNGSILPGVTRDSILHVLRKEGLPVEERRISIDEVVEAHKAGKLQEAFGTGTAAVISPIGEFLWEGQQLIINNGEVGSLTQKLYDTLTGIQTGTVEDPFGWTLTIEAATSDKAEEISTL